MPTDDRLIWGWCASECDAMTETAVTAWHILHLIVGRSKWLHKTSVSTPQSLFYFSAEINSALSAFLDVILTKSQCDQRGGDLLLYSWNFCLGFGGRGRAPPLRRGFTIKTRWQWKNEIRLIKQLCGARKLGSPTSFTLYCFLQYWWKFIFRQLSPTASITLILLTCSWTLFCHSIFLWSLSWFYQYRQRHCFITFITA